jgi:hypothetical protein
VEEGEITMKFPAIEVPVACSMIELADRADHPFQRYFCYWAAFNNIYTLVAQRNGVTVQPNLDRTGQGRTERKWTYIFPSVRPPKEPEQIIEAVNELDVRAKDALISHLKARFFVERVPLGVTGNHDSLGQLINGVLNVSRTLNSQSPVWSPIDKQAYERYMAGDQSGQGILAEQIVFMLYTVRNNLVHGSKNPGEENELTVVQNALPLLELVVRAFIRS